ncbi:ras-related protein Rab-13-like [Octopus vulgaris]|uniref:Ras-related protein Rab-13-like n=3 Tax=Octopus TaxID=6643 RepID=A0AA36ARV4_OCTVU|nr:ras-related protein Rab-15 isoform X1 [Octopus sinensis]CAI9720431.1 ras-related protein Rab-13-like [Octopus vulgaris]
MAKCYDILVRLLLLGDTGVGKSCILCRYANDEFLDTHISTIGIDFKMRTVNMDNKVAKIQIWDTAGQERFEAITHQFYRRAQGVLLVYDLCSRTSFENLSKWLTYVDEFANEDTELLLLGNKSDRCQWREVSCEEGQKFAEQYNMKFFETSAKNRENIDKAFQHICEGILQKQSLKRSTQSLNTSTSSNSHLVHRGRSVLSLESKHEDNSMKTSEHSYWRCCAGVM